MPKKRPDLSERIAEEMIDACFMAGIALMIVLLGVNWFNMKYAWLGVVKEVSYQSGFAYTGTGSEVGTMLTALGNSFPFNYLFGTFSFTTSLIVAILLTLIGLIARLWTTRTKGKLISDIGKSIWIPAVVGIVSIFFLQLLAISHLHDYMSANSIAGPEIAGGLFAWNSYGQLFLIGVSLMIVGSVIKVIGRKNRINKMLLVGNVLFTGSAILISYYFIIRLLSLRIVLDSVIGRFMALLLVSNQYSNFTIAFCIYFFVFGKELQKFGRSILRKERKAIYAAHIQQLHQEMETRGAKVVGTTHHASGKDYPMHPTQIQGRIEGQYHKQQQTQDRYVEPKGNYRHPTHRKKR